MTIPTSPLPGTFIMNLPIVISLDGSEYVPLVQGGTTKRTTTGQIAGLANIGTGGLGAFVTAVDQHAIFPNARFLAAQSTVTTITDGGAGTSITVGIAVNGIGASQLRQSAALSVMGNAANATANVADIAAASDKQILRRSGTAIGFGAIDLSSSAAVGSNTVTLAGPLVTVGAFTSTFTMTGATGVTFPTTGTLATLAGAETLSNKTLTTPIVGSATPTAAGALGFGAFLNYGDGTNNHALANVDSAQALTNKTYNGNTWTPGTGTLAIGAGKTATVSNTLTFTGTDGSSVAFGTGGTIGAVGYSAVGQVAATATNDSAAAGKVGEYIESIVTSVSAVSLVTNTAKTVTSISLTAGDWDVRCVGSFIPAASTSITQVASSLSLVTNTMDVTAGRFCQNPMAAVVSGGQGFSISIPSYRLSLNTTTPVFLVESAIFTAGTCTGWGIISARRIR